MVGGIRAHRLADTVRGTGHVEDVVADLIGEPDALGVAVEALDELGRGVGRGQRSEAYTGALRERPAASRSRAWPPTIPREPTAIARVSIISTRRAGTTGMASSRART
jgi:hypothetical protein